MLTKSQEKIHRLLAAGLSADEIADKLEISVFTVRKQIDNIKQEVDWHKSTELAGLGICDFLGLNYSEVRNKIIASVLSILMVVSVSVQDERLRFRRITRRRYVQEFVIEIAA